ncbi:GxxExxY protein [Runella salmonicolor]|uniref:GxxExxY protein n=1 Tax=Runella salmonicolor TaxID=2950278 RepID=A0ABT1FTA3_9BACT|nr:GxxExxY protein [Runella salmonicolor]MCP1385002.1 GxxExxY protein [Runella salmonicolor]
MARSYTEFDNLTSNILKCAYDVHTKLGPGLLESAYKECLSYKLQTLGLFVEKEKAMPLIFEEVKLDCGYRIDILVEKTIVLELKSVEALNDVHTSQVLTYMRLGEFKIGYLMNFNVSSLRNGIKRYVL